MTTPHPTSTRQGSGTGAKLAAYGGILVAAFGAAAGLGAVVGPIDTGADVTHAGDDEHGGDGHGGDGHDDDRGDGAADPGRPHVPGVSVDADGIRLVPSTSAIPAGVDSTYSFRLVEQDGTTVTDFDVTHERELHLIVVARDSADYLHVHPERDAAGTWTAELPALPAGSYRAFADTQPAGADGITLGADLTVGDAVASAADVAAGGPPPVAVAAPSAGAVSATASVDGYDVTLEGTPAVGESELTFTVERDGAAVVPDPYLGASGHLVALRSADLAFVHVHPLDDATADEPAIRFAAELPTPGTYRLFLDVSLDGEVRSVPFAIEVPELVPLDEPHDEAPGGTDQQTDDDRTDDDHQTDDDRTDDDRTDDDQQTDDDHDDQHETEGH